MGDFTRKNYGGFPLCYEEELYDASKEYIPRIEGTKLECGIPFLNLNYIPIVTSRICNNKRKFYLFDFIKIWQTKDTTDLCKNNWENSNSYE